MPNQMSVPFHGANLLLVEHQNQPYVPMKMIVEGMGLDWASQFKKLKATPERWGVVMTTIPSIDENNEVSCLPLRKLFGWLNSLQVKRVREDIREKVIQYQNECDDVLYQYWTEHSAPQQPEITVLQVAKPSHQLQLQTYLSQLAYLRGVSIQTVEQELNQKLNTSVLSCDETQLPIINAHLKLLLREEEKSASPRMRALNSEAAEQGMKLISETEIHMMRYQLEQQQQLVEKLSNSVIAMSKKTQELLGSKLFA
ncbi:phage antirepressor N-terminal domain-containing protein [Aliivibrio fischeri]|uniref:phage antirepressor N-terminal domain-containing protein n=1 Tax=Aliivibrio fischeri TaxID=668 RepID=UPI001433316F|nr:phage antirepressor N-terminal domain-containing protein [Aliivibrio fischeri]MCE7556395.1 phage antirepressor N-terminal domain-containing protein [Aliivibrio fischeri]MCE7563040.1 phage antirepressor N-terminal domain-containing protein [Aliivibrio fischeri]MCE7571332.1 phage antirepressor N-terminal domain-containing protein [Aliivibrio fischeri]